jgi:hypothetical protein
MKTITKIIVISIAVITLGYFLSIDRFIKFVIETEGSRALHAQLDIERVMFHLLPTSLTLYGVQATDYRQPLRNLMQAETATLPLSIRDLIAHKLIIDTIEIHGLHFNQMRNHSGAIADLTPVPAADNAVSATNSPQLRDALQRAQQMLNHPLSSNGIDTNASITGAMLGGEFKPLLARISALLSASTTQNQIAHDGSDWQILARHIVVDGFIDFGSNALQFVGTLENITPQPQLFDVVTRFNLRNADGEPARFTASGTLDRRKLPQSAMRFDLIGFPLTQWPLSVDPDLKITVLSAQTDVQALLTLTGNQIDIQALARFQRVKFDISNGDSEIAQTAAQVWRGVDAFDINLQASGDVQNPTFKLNSSLDAPLAAALQQLQTPAPASPFSSP